MKENPNCLRQTDGRTDGRTDKVSYRGACYAPKNLQYREMILTNPPPPGHVP